MYQTSQLFFTGHEVSEVELEIESGLVAGFWELGFSKLQDLTCECDM